MSDRRQCAEAGQHDGADRRPPSKWNPCRADRTALHQRADRAPDRDILMRTEGRKRKFHREGRIKTEIVYIQIQMLEMYGRATGLRIGVIDRAVFDPEFSYAYGRETDRLAPGSVRIG